jgi:SAM-dependent methyltransferase
MEPETGPLAAPARIFEHEALPSGRVLVHDRTVAREAARALAARLDEAFALHGMLAVAGARRVAGDAVRAHGAFALHPKGFHRAGRGAPREAERFDRECDAIDHGVALVDASSFDAVRGAAILDPCTGYGALALLTLSLEVRRRGLGRCVSVASATLEEDDDAERALETHGFRSEIAAAHARSHLGLDLECCDLDAIPAGSPLRWNAPVWGAPTGFEKYDDRGAYHWNLYATHDAYRRRADALVGFLAGALGAESRRILDVGAGDGLFSGLFARLGHHAVALDPEKEAVALCTEVAAREGLGTRMRAIAGSADAVPAPDASFDAVLLLDVIEHLRNPVRALREIHRVLAPGGALLVATPAWRFGAQNDPVYHLDEYREDELARQLRCCGLEVVQTARIRGAYDDLVALCRRSAR